APQGGIIDITGTAFVVPNVRVKPAPAEVELHTQSTITAALSLLDLDPLNVMAKAKQPVTIADGRADVTGGIEFMLVKKLPADQIFWNATALLSDVRSENVVPGRVLSAASLDLRADTENLEISGSGRLGKVPFDGQFQTRPGK